MMPSVYPRDNLKFYSRILLIFFFFFFILYGLYFLYQRGRLTINGLPDGTTSVEIMGASTNIVESANSSSLGKVLLAGTYTVLIKNNNSSQLVTVKVGNFLSDTTVSAVLEDETPREFVAENPRGCISTIGESYMSYPCDGPVSGLMLHTVASERSPTITKKVRTVYDQAGSQKTADSIGVIEDFVDLNSKKLLLTYTTGDYGTEHNVYDVSLVNNELRLTFLGSVDGLGDTVFHILKVADGIILKGKNTPTLFRGSDFNNLTLVKKDEEADVVSYDINDDLSLSVYAKATIKKGLDDFEATQTGSVVKLVNQEGSKEKSFTSNVSRVNFCGDYICVLDDQKNLRVYDSAFTLMSTISNISDYLIVDGDVFMTRDSGVMFFDTKSLSGHIVFKNDGLKLSGIRSVNGRIYAVVNSGKKEHLLKLGEGDFADRALPELLANPFINTISIYKKYIFASPELGERIPTEEGTYEYDPSVKAIAKDSINQTIDMLSADLSGYNFLAIGL